MTWALLLDLLIRLLPQLAALLRELFPKTGLEGSNDQLDTRTAVEQAFNAMHAETWWYQWGKRAQLRVGRRFAMAHLPELAAARRGEPAALVLSAAEQLELART